MHFYVACKTVMASLFDPSVVYIITASHTEFSCFVAVLENGLEQGVRQKCLRIGMCLSQNHS